MPDNSEIFRVADAASLVKLRTDISSGRRQLTRRAFAIDFKKAPKEKQAELESRLNGAYFDCACQAATIGGFLAFAGSAAIAAASGVPLLSLMMAAIVIGSFFGGVAFGKITGRLNQARNLKAIVSEMITTSGLSHEVNELSSYGDGALCAH